jgi:transposase
MTTGNILSATFCAGRKHDFQLFKETGVSLPHVLLLADAGYQGVAKIHPNSQTPFKKTKLHPLNKEQKASNQTLSRKRILIEHIFRRLKVFRILNERYRNRRKRFGLRFSLIAAVYNMELKIADGLLMQEVYYSV